MVINYYVNNFIILQYLDINGVLPITGVAPILYQLINKVEFWHSYFAYRLSNQKEDLEGLNDEQIISRYKRLLGSGKLYSGSERFNHEYLARYKIYIRYPMITAKGQLYVSANNCSGQLCLGYTRPVFGLESVPSFPQAKYVSCGYYHLAVITLDDELFMCGCNRYGQLGIPIIEETNVPQYLRDKVERVICCPFSTFCQYR